MDTIDAQTDWEMAAHSWQEHVRLAQEALTLIRAILIDNVLGGQVLMLMS